ncbi:MAG: sn-glycerol-3-phosphate ABC transporter ATP-binding protein UgpC [Solimonas sp.]
MASVQIRELHKSFGTTPVIRGVSVDIADGEFVVLVGPSGCGKSTLLRAIAGLEDVDGGEIRIGGRRVNELPPKARDIAMVFQSYALYPQMTVAQNMAFALTLAGVDKAGIARKVADAAAILGLDALLQRYPRELSGGQRQRVAMGRAIVRSPQVFLFDEPLSNLDAKLRGRMRIEIKELHQRLRTTMIYVTHDQIEAMTLADQIVVMRDGVVEQAGAPLDLYDRPANLFVAEFIGAPAMNLLRGRAAGGVLSTPEGLHLPLPSPPPDGEFVWGIRPEHWTIGHRDRDRDGLPARVVVVEHTGAETHVVARIGDREVICLLRDRSAIAPGAHVRLLPDIAKAHLFDAATQRRVACA